MSPEPYVRYQALAVALLLVAAATLGSPLAALCCALGGTLLAVGLYSKYRRDVTTARMRVPRHRERLDAIVSGDARAALGIGVTLSAALVAFEVQPPQDAVPALSLVLLALVAEAIYVSSLMDWFVILPRISGQLGIRPCRSDADHARFPKTWRETTRWWYIHRIIAALVVRFGLSFALSAAVAEHVDLPGGATVVAGAAVGSLAAYVAAVPRAVFHGGGHPTMIVGDTIRLRKTERLPLATIEFGRHTLRIPGFRRRTQGRFGRRLYVYDIALEQVQVVPASKREKAPPVDDDGRVKYERRPEKVLLKHAHEVKPAERPFKGCAQECSGISWYCIENPRCFDPK